MEKIVIDGYNLMWTTDTLNPVARYKFDLARDLLEKMLAEYASRVKEKVILVLDGYKGSKLYTVHKQKNDLEIVITAKGVNADRWIIETISRDDFEGAVVSSDREIVNFAKSHGAELITSKTFEHQMMGEIKDNRQLMDEIHDYKRKFRRRHRRKHS